MSDMLSGAGKGLARFPDPLAFGGKWVGEPGYLTCFEVLVKRSDFMSSFNVLNESMALFKKIAYKCMGTW